jgi:hypothetical protein
MYEIGTGQRASNQCLQNDEENTRVQSNSGGNAAGTASEELYGVGTPTSRGSTDSAHQLRSGRSDSDLKQ